MANPTMTLIGSPITVGSGGVSSVTFTSIPSTYTDLLVKVSARDLYPDVTPDILVTFNGSGSGYSNIWLQGNGSSASSSSYSGAFIDILSDGSTATTNTFSNIEMYIPNYAVSHYKAISVDNVLENNATASYMRLLAGLWSNTAAITSISFAAATSFVQYSTFYLYGINNS